MTPPPMMVTFMLYSVQLIYNFSCHQTIAGKFWFNRPYLDLLASLLHSDLSYPIVFCIILIFQPCFYRRLTVIPFFYINRIAMFIIDINNFLRYMVSRFYYNTVK